VRAMIVAAALAVPLAMSGTALADTGLKFPDENAACVAQAWVPANTDPSPRPATSRPSSASSHKRASGARKSGKKAASPDAGNGGSHERRP
jgi:hypothetical protein